VTIQVVPARQSGPLPAVRLGGKFATRRRPGVDSQHTDRILLSPPRVSASATSSAKSLGSYRSGEFGERGGDPRCLWDVNGEFVVAAAKISV
jgi:hypothetical protein